VLARQAPIPDYDAIRTAHYLYVEYLDGDRELYDTKLDPQQVHNLAGTRPHIEHGLAARIARLEVCHDRTCRAADSRPAT
jgi:hypothetical protein